jgi:predicted dehydrogenase
MTLRVGIIGAGQAGERNAAGFAATPTTSIVAVADVSPSRAQALAQRFGAMAYDDWRTMLAQGLDILVVCLPHNMHVEPCVAAAKQGVHVLMEKPIATTMDDGRRIVEVCREHSVKLTTSFVHRFREECQLVHGWARAGELGQVMMARETLNGLRGPHLPAWINSKELAGGGVLMYTAVHGLDRLRWLLDSDVVEVTAQAYHLQAGLEVEDGIMALLRFANGTAATLSATAPIYRAQPGMWETELFGTQGMARLRNRQWAELSNDRTVIHEDTQPVAAQQGEHYNFARQAAAFASAILEDREPVITGEDGLAALETALAIYRSAESGRTVTI